MKTFLFNAMLFLKVVWTHHIICRLGLHDWPF